MQGKITGNLKTAPVQQHNHSLSLNNTAKAPPTLPIKQRSKPATKDIDPDAVQCLFFENGSVECLPECSIREVQVSVNSGMQSIWMRECAKNRAPIKHTWQINDGKLNLIVASTVLTTNCGVTMFNLRLSLRTPRSRPTGHGPPSLKRAPRWHRDSPVYAAFVTLQSGVSKPVKEKVIEHFASF